MLIIYIVSCKRFVGKCKMLCNNLRDTFIVAKKESGIFLLFFVENSIQYMYMQDYYRMEKV